MKGLEVDGFLGTLPSFKQTLHQTFLYVSGQHEISTSGSNKMFLLAGIESRANISDTLIISSAIQHSRENGSIILDAWIIPMTHAKRNFFFNLLAQLPGTVTVFELKKMRPFCGRRSC